MSLPQSEQQSKAFAPKDKTIEVIGMAAFFIICVLMAAFNEFERGSWWTGSFFLMLVVLVIGAQVLFLKGHESTRAEIVDRTLVLRQGNEWTSIDLWRVQSLSKLKVKRGSYGTVTQYWASMRDGQVWKLFEGGTFNAEEDLLQEISDLAGADWQE